MKRRLRTFLTALSLAAFLATAWLWAASPWGYDRQPYDERSFAVGTGRYFLASRSGGLRLIRQRIADRSGSPTITADVERLGCWQIKYGSGTIGTARFGPAEPRRMIAGFGRDAREYQKTVTFGLGPTYQATSFVLEYRVWAVPYWPLLCAFGLLPLLRLSAWHLRRRRSSAGRCPDCGYDLRATPYRCPECGTEKPLAIELSPYPPAPPAPDIQAPSAPSSL